LQLGPPNQPDLTELLIQINQNIAPQYEDQSGDFLATLDTAQLMSMMSRFENAEAAIQGAYLQPVVQTGTIASYNLDGSPTAGGIAYGTGPALAVSAAGTTGQVLTSATAGTPTWTTPTTGTVTSVAALTLGTTGTDLSSTVANPTTTPVITLQVPTASASNRGALSAADWTTFNNKGSGTVTSVTGTAPVVSSGGTTPAISMAAATTSVNGYLTSTDWNTFNGKGSGSVTSVAQSFTGGLISVAGSPITTSGTLALTVAGTSGGIPYFTSTSTWASSAALAAGSLVLGGGGGATPATTTTGTGVVTALGVNTGTAGAFVVNGGALGTPSSGTVTNLTGTASININGTVGATTPTTGSFTTLATGSTVTFSNTSGAGPIFNSTSASGGFATWQRSGVAKAYFGAGLQLIGTLTADDFAIDARAGNLALMAGGAIIGLASSTGLAVTGKLSATTGAAVGGATPGAGGLAFPATAVAVADVNTLDDYEEGTWTPTLSFTTPGNLSVTYIRNVGSYKKIGAQVIANCSIVTATFTHTTASGNATITTLPFTTAATYYNMAALSYEGITAATLTSCIAYLNPSATTVFIVGCGSAVGQAAISTAEMPTATRKILEFTMSYSV